MELKNRELLKTGLFINNEWKQGSLGKRFWVTNPATGENIAEVEDASADDTHSAIQAANSAFASWSQTTALERSLILKKWFQLVSDNADDLALLLTTEEGKPLAEAKTEILYGASFIQWFAEECRRVYGETIPTPDKSKRLLTIKQPIGVVAAITPWNFPNAMITRKVAPAIAAGCTVVLKPAHDTPLSALALAELAREAGMPEGVLNILPSTDSKSIGKILSTHPAIQKLSFTGSTAIGRILMQQSAPTLKKLAMELGGNAPFIVFDDANLEEAIKGSIASKFRNAGQTCVCTNRFFVQRGIYDAFVEKLNTAVSAFKIGNGTAPGVNIGPLINENAVEKVENLVKDALDKGARLILGGHKSAEGPLFYEPTILSQVTTEMDLSHEEIFGPVAAIYAFDTEEQAVFLANSTEYGLAAYFYTDNIKRATRVAEALDYGIVGINEGAISYTEGPFGGVKQSGFGREGSHYGIEEYMTEKYLCMGGL